MRGEYTTDRLREFLAGLTDRQVKDYAGRLGVGERPSRKAYENAICYEERMRRKWGMPS